MFSPPLHTRRRALGMLCSMGLPVSAGQLPRYVVQGGFALGYTWQLLQYALRAAGFSATFEDMAVTSEARNLHETQKGNLHMSMLPASPARLELVRQGRLRMLPIPLERGLLGWRACFVLQQHEQMLAQVRQLQDLRRFTIGQGINWLDVAVLRAAGLSTREVPHWGDGQFCQQLQARQIDLFVMGLDESLNYYLPHFRKRYPQLLLDQHLLLYYPWYRVLWISAHPSADALYEALSAGFDQVVHEPEFLQLWNRLRPPLPPSVWNQRTIVPLQNPWFDSSLIPSKYQHLLLTPQWS